MFKKILAAAKIFQGVQSLRDDQLDGIYNTAWQRVSALKARSSGKQCEMVDGDIVVKCRKEGSVTQWRTRFKARRDWDRLVGLVANEDLRDLNIVHPGDDTSCYTTDGWRFWLPPTCNVKYHEPETGRVIDCGAVQA